MVQKGSSHTFGTPWQVDPKPVESDTEAQKAFVISLGELKIAWAMGVLLLSC